MNTVRETLLAVEGVNGVDITLQTTAASTVRIDADHDVEIDLVQRSLAERGDFRIRR